MSFFAIETNGLFLIYFCDVLQQKLFGTMLINFYFKLRRTKKFCINCSSFW